MNTLLKINAVEANYQELKHRIFQEIPQDYNPALELIKQMEQTQAQLAALVGQNH